MTEISSAKPVPSVTEGPTANENEYPKGYHKLAAFMGGSRRLSIFRRFGNLTMLNLLTLQAELLNLESEYRSVHLENNKDHDTEKLSTSVLELRISRDDQWQIALEIRKKLNEYHTALLQAAELFKLDHAPLENLNSLKDWFIKNRFLQAFEANAYEKDDGSFQPDLITLYDYKGLEDPVPPWMGRLFQTILAWSPGGKPKLDEETGSYTTQINRRSINYVGTIIAAFFSSVIPLSAMIALYYVKGTPQRLGVAAGFMFAFAIALVTLTKVKKNETFAAVAGFAAVEVIFIGSVS